MTSPQKPVGTGVATNGLGKRTTAHLNLTRSLAEVYDIRKVWTGNGNAWQWRVRDKEDA